MFVLSRLEDEEMSVTPLNDPNYRRKVSFFGVGGFRGEKVVVITLNPGTSYKAIKIDGDREILLGPAVEARRDYTFKFVPVDEAERQSRGDIKITVVDVRSKDVRFGITCPKTYGVHRREIYEAIEKERLEAAKEAFRRGGE